MAAVLETVVADAQAKAQLSGRQAEEILRSITIPSCPAILSALLHEARQDEVDFLKITRLVASDVGLAASVLKTANSPFFALRAKVPNVQQAIAVLGLKNLLSIIQTVTLRASLSPPGVNMERFWDRSGYTAVACAHIARHTRTADRELAYTFGLFHDCGIPILMQRFPEYKQTLARANEAGRGMLDIEYAQHATNHAIVGAMLARNWQLPPQIVLSLTHHHDFELLDESSAAAAASGTTRALIAIGLLAAYAVARFLEVREEKEWVVFGDRAMAYLGIDDRDLEELVVDIREQLADIRACKL